MENLERIIDLLQEANTIAHDGGLSVSAHLGAEKLGRPNLHGPSGGSQVSVAASYGATTGDWYADPPQRNHTFKVGDVYVCAVEPKGGE